MLANERNEAQYVHIKEILEGIQVEISSLKREDDGPSHE